MDGMKGGLLFVIFKVTINVSLVRMGFALYGDIRAHFNKVRLLNQTIFKAVSLVPVSHYCLDTLCSSQQNNPDTYCHTYAAASEIIL